LIVSFQHASRLQQQQQQQQQQTRQHTAAPYSTQRQQEVVGPSAAAPPTAIPIVNGVSSGQWRRQRNIVTNHTVHPVSLSHTYRPRRERKNLGFCMNWILILSVHLTSETRPIDRWLYIQLYSSFIDSKEKKQKQTTSKKRKLGYPCVMVSCVLVGGNHSI